MINIYDFDDTIFSGDSTARFCRYVLGKRPALALKLPRVGGAFLLYALSLRTKTWAKQVLYRALLTGTDAESLLDAFWLENMGRIKSWYIAQKRADDIVISASPEFLLRPACKQLGITQLLASRVDMRTGDYDGLNCHGEEKVRRYRAECPQGAFQFYSDSMSDAPMARLAEQAYMVTGDEIKPWPAA